MTTMMLCAALRARKSSITVQMIQSISAPLRFQPLPPTLPPPIRNCTSHAYIILSELFEANPQPRPASAASSGHLCNDSGLPSFPSHHHQRQQRTPALKIDCTLPPMVGTTTMKLYPLWVRAGVISGGRKRIGQCKRSLWLGSRSSCNVITACSCNVENV